MAYFELYLFPNRDRWPAIKGRENVVLGESGNFDDGRCAATSREVRGIFDIYEFLRHAPTASGKEILQEYSESGNALIPRRYNQQIDFQTSSASVYTTLTAKKGKCVCKSVNGGRSNECSANSLKGWVPVHSAYFSGRLLSVVVLFSPEEKTKPFYTYLLQLFHNRLTVGGAHKKRYLYGPRFIAYYRVLLFISMYTSQKIQNINRRGQECL
jgi:hypothetical protein